MKGDVLDIGGRDFFVFVGQNKKISFNTWTSLDLVGRATEFSDSRYKLVVGDGEATSFPDESFDTILNVQVMEHTLHPQKMLEEIRRLLKPKGVAIIVVPQTSAMHEIPTHYYNFTRSWVERAFPEAGLQIKNIIFYLLFPFMCIYAFLGIIMGLIFSFGDLTEDPNNLIITATK